MDEFNRCIRYEAIEGGTIAVAYHAASDLGAVIHARYKQGRPEAQIEIEFLENAKLRIPLDWGLPNICTIENNGNSNYGKSSKHVAG